MRKVGGSMFDNSALLIIMLLAYSVVEFIFPERLNLLPRTILLILILAANLFWRSVSLDYFIVVPIAAFSYLAISYLQSKVKLAMAGREFFNLLIKNLTHIVAFAVIFIPFQTNWYPVSLGTNFFSWDVHNWEIILMILIANIWFAPRLIKAVLNDLTYRTSHFKASEGDMSERIVDHGAYQAGKLIGILERLLIIVTVLLTSGLTINLSLIGFILGTKSLARFKKFDSQEFVEYFIVGTMTSVLFSLLSIWPLKYLLFN